MATLPDLDTTTAGHVAYFNVVNETALGESEMTWADATENNSVNSFEVYDNGYILQYNDARWNDVTIRVKTDGWVVAYTGWDGNVNGVDGPSGHNIMMNPIDNPSGFVKTRLAQHIKDVVTSLTQWSTLSKDFDFSKVGLYEFNYQPYGISYFHDTGGDDRVVNESSGTVTDHGVVAIKLKAGYEDNASVSVDGTQIAAESDESIAREVTEVTSALSNTGDSITTYDNASGLSELTYVLYWSETA